MAGTYGHDAKQVENSKGIYGLSWADPWPACRRSVAWPPVIRAVARSKRMGAQSTHCRPAGTALMLQPPQGFRVPKAHRHPHFLLLPVSPDQAVVGFVAMLREREQLHQLFRPDDVWPSDHFGLSQHGPIWSGSARSFSPKPPSPGLWSPDRGAKSSGAASTSTLGAAGGGGGALFWKVAEAPITDAEEAERLRAWLGKVWRWPEPRLPGRELALGRVARGDLSW